MFFKSALTKAKEEIRENFSSFLEKHDFIAHADPKFEAVYKKFALLYRSPKLELMIGMRDDFYVLGRPVYADEPWYSMSVVLAVAVGSSKPIACEKNSELASLMEANYEGIEHFFSPSNEAVRKKSRTMQ